MYKTTIAILEKEKAEMNARLKKHVSLDKRKKGTVK